MWKSSRYFAKKELELFICLKTQEETKEDKRVEDLKMKQLEN